MRGTPACAKPVQMACSKLYNRDHRVGNSNYQENVEIQRVGNTYTTTEVMPRPRRKDPYYFDIRNRVTGDVERYYFYLRR